MSKRKWINVRIAHEVYVSSDGHYELHVLLVGDGNTRLALDYADGLWLYRDSRDFREYEPPQYVLAMFKQEFEVTWNLSGYRHYEYRKVGNELIEDYDPQSLRYYDEATWTMFANSIMSSVSKKRIGEIMSDDDILIDHEQQKREIAEAFKQYLRGLQNNVCPHCGMPITNKRQVGRCVYADPCGCRLYQGRLNGKHSDDDNEVSS